MPEVTKTLDISKSLVWKNAELTRVARHPEYGIIPLFTRQGGEFLTSYSELIKDDEQENVYFYFEYNDDQDCWDLATNHYTHLENIKEYVTLFDFFYQNPEDFDFVKAYYDDPNLLID